MDQEKAEYKHRELTEKVIKAFYTVYNVLGYGFLEKVYENALLLELAKANISVLGQAPIRVFYEGKVVGEYFADLMIEDKLVIEIKATSALIAEHEAQLLNYLKATKLEVGLLLNFGPKPEVKRKAFDNRRKGICVNDLSASSA